MHRTTLGKYGLLIAPACQDFGANRTFQPFADGSKDLISQFVSQTECKYPGMWKYRHIHRLFQSLPYFTEQDMLHFYHCLPTVASLLFRSLRNLTGPSKYTWKYWSAFSQSINLCTNFIGQYTPSIFYEKIKINKNK